MTPSGLVAARTSLGLGQAALARALGMSTTAVWRWEKGERPIPPWLPLALEGLEYQALVRRVRAALAGYEGSPEHAMEVVDLVDEWAARWQVA